jgi:hypothetical protein
VFFAVNGINYIADIDSEYKPLLIKKFDSLDASHFMTGNPDKNAWFNENATNITEETIQEGVVRLVCKEFFGDVLIALVALAYKKYHESDENSLESCAAVFTGDYPLTSLCITLKVNVVSRLRKDYKSECMAYLFIDNDDILHREKMAEIDTIIKNNVLCRNELITLRKNICAGVRVKIEHIDEELDMRTKAAEARAVASFLFYIAVVINGIIANLHHLKGDEIDVDNEINIRDTSESFIRFKQKISKYSIPSIIRRINKTRGNSIYVKFVNIKNIFPPWTVYHHTDRFDTSTFRDKRVIVDKIKLLLSSLRVSHGEQRGGALLPPMKGGDFSKLKRELNENPGNADRKFDLEEEEKNPTAYLQKVIQDVLDIHRPTISISKEATMVDRSTSEIIEIDVIDVYQLLYPIYEVSGTINYDPNFILFAIKAYLVSDYPDEISLMEFYHKNILKVDYLEYVPSILPIPQDIDAPCSPPRATIPIHPNSFISKKRKLAPVNLNNNLNNRADPLRRSSTPPPKRFNPTLNMQEGYVPMQQGYGRKRRTRTKSKRRKRTTRKRY